MAYSRANEIDPIDTAALVLFPIATGVVFGVWSMELNLFGGWSPTDALFEVAGASITWALLIVVAALAWILATNELGEDSYENYEFIIIAFGFAAPVLFVFVPSFQELVNYHDAVTMLTFLATAVAATWVSYTK